MDKNKNYTHFINMITVKKLIMATLVTSLGLTLMLIPEVNGWGLSNLWRPAKMLIQRGGADAATQAARRRNLIGDVIERSAEHIGRMTSRSFTKVEQFRDLTAAAVAGVIKEPYPGTSLLNDFEIMKKYLSNDDVKLVVVEGQEGLGKNTLIDQLAYSQTARNQGDLPSGLRVTDTPIANKRIYRFDTRYYLETVDGEHRKHYIDQIAKEIKDAKNQGIEVIIHVDRFEDLVPRGSADAAAKEDPTRVFFDNLGELTENAQVIATTKDKTAVTHSALDYMRDGIRRLEKTAPEAAESVAIIRSQASDLERRFGVSFSDEAVIQAARIAEKGYRGSGLPGGAIKLLREASADLTAMRASGEPYRVVELERKIQGIRQRAITLDDQFWRNSDPDAPAGTRPTRPAYVEPENFDINTWPNDKPFLREERIKLQREFEQAQKDLAEIREKWPELQAKAKKVEELEEELAALRTRISEASADEQGLLQFNDTSGRFAELRENRTASLEQVKDHWEEWKKGAFEGGEPDFARLQEADGHIARVQAEIDKINEITNEELLTSLLEETLGRLRMEYSAIGYGVDIDTDLLIRTAALAEKGEISEEAIGIIKARLTGDTSIFRELDGRVTDWIVGQTNIIHDVLRIMQTKLTGDTHGVKGVFGLFGESSLGKTELAKALSKIFGGSKILTIEGGQFQEAHRISSLLGPPPGYKGADEGGMLVNFIRDNPSGVVLVDELEKMDVSMLDVFLTVTRDGYITDSLGRKLDASGITFVFTGNVFRDLSPEDAAKVQDMIARKDFSSLKTFIRDDIMKQPNQLNPKTGNPYFRPEMINRMDGAYILQQFMSGEMTTLVKRMFGKFVKSFTSKNIAVRPSDEVFELMAGRAARNGDGGTMRNSANVENTLSTYIDARVLEMTTNGRVKEGDIVNVRLKKPGSEPHPDYIKVVVDGEEKWVPVPPEGVRVYFNEDYLTNIKPQNAAADAADEVQQPGLFDDLPEQRKPTPGDEGADIADEAPTPDADKGSGEQPRFSEDGLDLERFTAVDEQGRRYAQFDFSNPQHVEFLFNPANIQRYNLTTAVQNLDDILHFEIVQRGISNAEIEEMLAAQAARGDGAIEDTTELLEGGARSDAEQSIGDAGMEATPPGGE